MAHAHHHDHDFHIPAPSIWPPLSCLGVGLIVFGFIAKLHPEAVHNIPALIAGWFTASWPAATTWLTGLQTQLTAANAGYTIGWALTAVGLGLLLAGMCAWFYKLIQEARARGFGLGVPRVLEIANRYGMVFFIASEVMFFAAFFAAFFYLRTFNPAWPPENITTLPLELPIINTLILLTSGATITWAHYALFMRDRVTLKNATLATAVLGFIFLGCQVYEYGHAEFAFNSGVYGSLFYMLTGFHGFHVLVGSIMLAVLYARLREGDFTPKQHFYFEAAAWYWHFVDVVWIGLFLFVYLL